MQITEIYQRYKIMPQLQEHQLRVAAVAKIICDHLRAKVETDTIITACLLHDMANIIKFDLSPEVTAKLVPQVLKDGQLEYWQGVQQEFIQKYGLDEHKASIEIAKELGLNGQVLKCIENIDFAKALENVQNEELEPKICDYADLRVGPKGILSIKERLEEGRERYKDRTEKWIAAEKWGELNHACLTVERQIFALASIRPEDITDESVKLVIEELKAYKI